jgi:uncharacterized SAM-binding protein YcdF (DUF218 family)
MFSSQCRILSSTYRSKGENLEEKEKHTKAGPPADKRGQRFNLLLYRAIVSSGFLIFAMVSAQLIYFSIIYSGSREITKPSDLIAVFPGGSSRMEAGFHLAESGTASHLVINNQGIENLKKRYAKLLGHPPSVMLHTYKSTSTFEDALSMRKIIQSRNFSSIILVTSAYHMPRAHFVLRVLLFDRKIHIDRFGVGRAPDQATVYNEIIKFWGSIGEMIYYNVTGALLSENPSAEKVIGFLKKYLLFPDGTRDA